MRHEPLTPGLILSLIVKMTLIVLSVEILVMMLFRHFQVEGHLSYLQEAVADSLLLLLLSAYPALIWVIRPMFHAAQASSKRTEMLAAALENAGESVIITSADCIIVHVNKAFEKASGFSFEQAVGHNPNMLKADMQDSAFYEAMWNSLNSKGEWKGELWNCRQDGSLYPAMMHIRTIRDEHGCVQYYIGTFSDISDRLALEKAARQSQKMEALSTLVGGVAHNFNNILSGMLGKTYLAKKRSTSDEVIRHLDDINQLGLEGSSLIRQLLSFSQESTHNKQQVPVVTLFKATLKAVQLGMSENIRLKTDFPQCELIVFGDAGQLQQLFVNLIGNAIDAIANSPEKNIHITLEEGKCATCPHTDSCDASLDPCIRLTIEDSGCGILATDMEHIFDPFFSTKKQGTGLGLSMVKGAIAAHGGLIHAESNPGQGTKVITCLPLYRPQTNPSAENNYII